MSDDNQEEIQQIEETENNNETENVDEEQQQEENNEEVENNQENVEENNEEIENNQEEIQQEENNEEENGEKKKKRKKDKKKKKKRSEEGGEDGEKKKKKKKDKKKKKKNLEEGGEEGGENEENSEEPKKKKKKSKKKKQTEEESTNNGSGQARPSQVFMEEGGITEDDNGEGTTSDITEVKGSGGKEKSEFDLMMSEISKSKRRRSNKDTDLENDESLDQIAEDLLEKMRVAYDNDVDANKSGKPAMSKLELLQEVIEKVPNLHLQPKLVEKHLLVVLNAWLQPLPDQSLPNLKIRTSILKLLNDLPVKGDSDRIRRRDEEFQGINRDHLKDSKIAQTILKMSKSSQETTENQRMANNLVQKWARLVFFLSSNYRQLPKVESEIAEKNLRIKREAQLNSMYNKKPEVFDDGETPSARAKMPRPANLDFFRRPEKKISETERQNRSVGETQMRLKKRMNDLHRTGNGKTQRAISVSVEGRGTSHVV